MKTITNSELEIGQVDLALVESRASELGFRRADLFELAQGITLAETLMESKIASVAAVAEMDQVTGMTAWVTGAPVDGIFLTLPLSARGESAVRNGSYNPAKPDPAHLCAGGRECAAIYIGVYAGATREARKRVMMAAGVMRVEMFSPYPCFARGATEDGKRSMESLGFIPFHGGLPDLYVQEALVPIRSDVA